MHTSLTLIALLLMTTPADARASEGRIAEPSAGPVVADTRHTARTLGRDMARYVLGLSEEQREKASYDFDDDERFDLRLAPFGMEGLRISEMSEAQWSELEALLGGVLSDAGLVKLNTIRSLEREVAAVEGGFMGLFMGRIRDPKRYFLALFGDPAEPSPWGFRLDGHHLSLNTTVVPGAPVSATPLFLGGQPAEVPAKLERAGLRVLGLEEDLAVAFLNGLSSEERAKAYLAYQEGGLISRPMSVNEPVEFVMPEPAGLARETLSADSRAALDALIDIHLDNFEAGIAARYREELFGNGDAAGARITVAYGAAVDMPGQKVSVGKALYYRIQGGGLSIEFDNTSLEAQHIHLLYRHAENDFGRDLLREHREAAH